MSLYVARVVGPAGAEYFLCRGRLSDQRHATIYTSPSAARAALERFQARVKGWFYTEVIDAADPERGALA